MQFKGKLMKKSEKIAKELNFGFDLRLFSPNLDPKNFFSWVLPLLGVRHCRKL